MLEVNSILQLFENVLNEDIDRYGISQLEIRRAIQNMAHVYAPQPGNLQLTTVNVANYNDAAHRVAYLHKYAAFHTAMVHDTILRILEQRSDLFKRIISSNEFSNCSLGGGPGNDVLGVIAALNTFFSTFKVYVTVVDLMEQWEFTFKSLIAELADGNYGTLQTGVSDNFLQWNYIGANLLDELTDPVKIAISEASLIIMVKFVSAAACLGTEKMIKRIFRAMKPGALLLYIDNAGGGFRHLMQKAANKYECNTVFGPLNHYNYCNDSLKNERFGYTSCFTTTVTIHLFQKSLKQQRRKFPDYMSVSSDSENDNISGDLTRATKPITEKKINSHSNSSLSHNYYGLHENTDLPGRIINEPLSTYQQNASVSSDVTLSTKPVSAKNINPYSNLSTSHINPRLAQSASLPANVNKDYIPVPPDQKNTSISSDVIDIEKSVSKTKIHPQTDASPSHSTSLFQDAVPVNFPVCANTSSTSQNINNFNKSINSPKINPDKSNLPDKHLKAAPTSVDSSRSHNTPLFQDVVPVNYPVCANTSSTSQNINNFNKSVDSSKIYPDKSNLPDNHLKAAPTSGNSVLRDNTSMTKTNGNTSPKRPNDNRGSYTAVPTKSNRTSSVVSTQSEINAFPELEDNSDTCCSCCVIF